MPNLGLQDTSPPVAGTVYRVGFAARGMPDTSIHASSATRFEAPGEFSVLYWAVDDAGNRGSITRVFVVDAAPAAATAGSGLGAGGLSAIGAAVAAVVLFFVVGLIVSRRRAAATKTAAGGPTPPSPEAWFHGEIDRQVADTRLLAAGVTGAFLVRSKRSETEPASFVLSVLAATGRPTHYTVTVPTDGSAAAVFQGVAADATWGSCLADVIATLEVHQPGFPVKTPLAAPAPIPSNARALARLFEPPAGTARPSVAAVYAEMTGSPGRFPLSTAFRLVPNGLFYRLFQPVARVADGVVLYELTDAGDQSQSRPVRRGRIADESLAWTEVYVRVEPGRLPALLGVAPDVEHGSADGGLGYRFGGGAGQPAVYNPMFGAAGEACGDDSCMAASGSVIYDSRGSTAGDAESYDGSPAQPQCGETYATVNKGASRKGKQQQQQSQQPQHGQQQRALVQRYAIPTTGGGIVYSAVDHGDIGAPAPAVESEVMYSSVAVAAPGTSGRAAAPPIFQPTSDVVYTTVKSTPAAPRAGGRDRPERAVYGESRPFARVSDDGRHLRLEEPMYMESST